MGFHAKLSTRQIPRSLATEQPRQIPQQLLNCQMFQVLQLTVGSEDLALSSGSMQLKTEILRPTLDGRQLWMQTQAPILYQKKESDMTCGSPLQEHKSMPQFSRDTSTPRIQETMCSQEKQTTTSGSTSATLTILLQSTQLLTSFLIPTSPRIETYLSRM